MFSGAVRLVAGEGGVLLLLDGVASAGDDRGTTGKDDCTAKDLLRQEGGGYGVGRGYPPAR